MFACKGAQRGRITGIAAGVTCRREFARQRIVVTLADRAPVAEGFRRLGADALAEALVPERQVFLDALTR